MEYIHVKNLEKYQPHYNDGRRLLWIRWDIDAIGDYRISKLTPAQRWLFIGLVCLETKHSKVFNDISWLAGELKYPVKCIANDLKVLQKFELLVTSCDNLSQDVTTCDPHNIHNIHNITEQKKWSFDEVWGSYPNKVGRKEAERHFRASVKSDEDYTALKTALEIYKKSERVRKGFIQNGSRWFNDWKSWVKPPEQEGEDVPESLRPYIKKG